MELFKKPNINFINLRWFPIGASILVVILSVAVMAIKGFNYSIEFTGGTLLQVGFPAAARVDVDDVRKALETAGVRSEIQSVQADRPTFILREKGTEMAAVDAFVAKTMDALKNISPGAEPSLDRKDSSAHRLRRSRVKNKRIRKTLMTQAARMTALSVHSRS